MWFFFTKNGLLCPGHGATVHGTGLLDGLDYERKVVKGALSRKDPPTLSLLFSH